MQSATMKMAKICFIVVIGLLIMNACTMTDQEEPYNQLQVNDSSDAYDSPHAQRPLSTTEIQAVEVKRTELKLDELKERWNNLTIDLQVGLELKQIRVDEENHSFSASFSDVFDLKGEYVPEKKLIWKLQWLNSSEQEKDRYTMLEGWTHIIAITNPDLPLHEIDILFHQLGVGPNADVSKAIGKELELNGVHYQVDKQDGIYRLTATIVELSPERLEQ